MNALKTIEGGLAPPTEHLMDFFCADDVDFYFEGMGGEDTCLLELAAVEQFVTSVLTRAQAERLAALLMWFASTKE